MMNKKIIRTIALVLVLVILGPSSVFALGGVMEDNNERIKDSVTITNSEGITLVAKDFESGNGLYELYINDNLTIRGYLDRSEGILFEELFDESGRKTDSIYRFDNKTIIHSETPSLRTSTAGVIGYDLYDSGNNFVGTTTVSVSGTTGTTTQDSIDLYGSYHDIVYLASAISFFVNMPDTISAFLACDIIGVLGFPLDFIDLLIPHKWLDCDIYTVNWSGTEYGTGYSGSMVSKKFVCRMTEGLNQVYYNNWYGIQALAGHNAGLAVAIYQALQSIYVPSPTSWTIYY